jgi:hypothetical protein
MLTDLRIELIKKIQTQSAKSAVGPLPVVSLEDFFCGDSDYGSIGCNLSNTPGPQVFFNTLKTIRDDDSVQDVLVEVNEVVEEDPQTWPLRTVSTYSRLLPLIRSLG